MLLLEPDPFDFFPTVLSFHEVRTLGPGHDVVDELVVHPARPQVYELAVGQVREEQIVEQLPLVPRGQCFDRLEFEDCSAANEQVKVVGLAEILELHVEGHLALGIGNSEGDFPVVNLFMEQSAQLALARRKRGA